MAILDFGSNDYNIYLQCLFNYVCSFRENTFHSNIMYYAKQCTVMAVISNLSLTKKHTLYKGPSQDQHSFQI